MCCVGGTTGCLPSEGRYHHSDLQVNIWELARAASPCEQTGLCGTDPGSVRTPLFLSSLSLRSPVATTLYWTFACILAPCFGFFSHRWINLGFSWLKISILPILKPSWISSLAYGDVRALYYWLRIWPTCCSLLGIVLSINQYSC